MFKYIFINQLLVSKKTPAGRTEQDFESQSIVRLAQIVELAVKEKARLIFTSPWLGSVSDKGAYKVAALLAKVSHTAAIECALTGEAAQEALEIKAIKAASDADCEKSPVITCDAGIITVRAGEQSEAINIENLPNATGHAGSTYAKVGLLAIGKQRGRSSKNVCKFETVTIADDSSYIKAENPDPNVKASFLQARGESEFVNRLKENLQQSHSQATPLTEKLEQSIKAKGLVEREGLEKYVKGLLENID